MDQEEAMTSFCAEEQDMDDIGAAGLLSEIENALGMGFGTLGCVVQTDPPCMFNNSNGIAENKVVCLSSPICGLLARLSVRSVLIRSANTIARVKTEAV
ncbi:hypothetical protein OUZ56_019929 [Daphnia magna]|uniref:Uncharacterized protein n=1 Tax=Daphnia magna TaxID=35525 RepID=A0ABQ9ZD21_9CRUS|nr:hypothetical protein OUZ56_019929 [Daphnia magna]